ncbi:endoplasmin-like [Abrus precatorius]|uniref:Endoplasmin-like n=1 Tax=Abrus precatorius TaxID=3816 RepID=A0A8B8K3R7_ABRPR|nr:endoplasmin-like [Abrus precatorius]
MVNCLLSNKINALTDGEFMEEEVNVEDDPLRSVEYMSNADTVIYDGDFYARHDHEEEITLDKSFKWNSKGQPIDPNRSKFGHFIKFVTRSIVPISYSDWTSVSANIKEHIWDQVEQTFNVKDEHKDFVLSLAGQDLRAFHTQMRKYILDKYGNCLSHPREKYHRFITVTDHWIEFVNQSCIEEFKKESEADAIKAKGMLYRYMRSVKVYAQLEQELIASSRSNVTFVPQHVLWKAAGMQHPKEVQKDEYMYNEFYKKTFNEFLEPLSYTHFTAEGEVEFRSILYFPGMGPL